MVRAVDPHRRVKYSRISWMDFVMSAEDKGDGPGRGQISPEEREAIRRRSSDIGRELDAVKARNAPAGEVDRQRGAAFGKAFSFAAELIVGVAFGAAIGWGLDRYFGTKPWLMVLFVISAFVVAILHRTSEVDGVAIQQEFLRKSCFASVGMRNDREGAASGDFLGRR